MDKSRREFEAWFSVNQNNHLDQLKRDQRGNYFYIVTRTAWDAWQASRESLINNLPESINCPTAPELIWLQVDPEPEEENKPVYPVNLRSDDVTWCADRVHPTDTLYIRAYLIQT